MNRQLVKREHEDLQRLAAAARRVLSLIEGEMDGALHVALDHLAVTVSDAEGGLFRVFCDDCDLEYGCPQWVDAIVTDEVWTAMGDCDGVLCANCMAARIRDRMGAPGVLMTPLDAGEDES